MHLAFERDEMTAGTADPANFISDHRVASISIPAPASKKMGFFESIIAIRRAELEGSPMPDVDPKLIPFARKTAIVPDGEIGDAYSIASTPAKLGDKVVLLTEELRREVTKRPSSRPKKVASRNWQKQARVAGR